MLLRYILDQELEDRAEGKKARIAFFLVDSVNLVFQQHRVIESNLPYKSDKFCGEMGCDLWSQTTWAEHLEKNMVIVCTAAVLKNILTHSFLKMEDINLLIFDEAHRAKKNHVYASIMMIFYHESADVRLPRVLGLTASPVDTKDQDRILQAINSLEQTLHAQIATTRDPASLQSFVQRPQELVLHYEPNHAVYTDLPTKLGCTLPILKAVRKITDQAKRVAADLGPWAADRAWRNLLAESELNYILESSEKETKYMSLQTQDELVKQLKSIVSALEQSAQTGPVLDVELSPKVRKLAKFFEERFTPELGSKCIVFVQTRANAKLLGDLFDKIGKEGMKVGVLIGNSRGRSEGVDSVHETWKQQQKVLQQFKDGSINCIFATSVAEEGLDISDCNMIVRFDLYNTMIQYVQSRGRARQKDSLYVHMAEEGNGSHSHLLQEVKDSEGILTAFCASLPEDRIITLDDSRYIDETSELFVDDKSGARLDWSSSQGILARYVATHPANQNEAVPTYVVTARGRRFICEVVLPEGMPLRNAVGKECSRKLTARNSAAFAACKELHSDGHLSKRFLPILRREKAKKTVQPSTTKLRLATSRYEMLEKPAFWSSTDEQPKQLFMAYMTISSTSSATETYKPIGVITQKPLPNIPDLQIWLPNSESAVLCLTSVLTPINVSAEDIKALSSFTTLVFEEVFNRSYILKDKIPPYWLCPVAVSITANSSITSANIAWDIIQQCFTQGDPDWCKTLAPPALAGRLIIDPRKKDRRFLCEGVAADLKASDPVPAEVSGSRRANIYSYSFWLAKADVLEEADRIPIVKCRLLPRRSFWVVPPTEEERKGQAAYLYPPAMKLSQLPALFAQTVSLFPALATHLDHCLLAAELLQKLDMHAERQLANSAITAYEMPDNPALKSYERLEYLGDRFLKLASALSVWVRYPSLIEHEMHVKGIYMVCNENLRKVGTELGLPKYIRSQMPNRRAWLPQGVGTNRRPEALPTKPKPKKTHALGDKTIADVAEAIIGAAYLSPVEGEHALDNAVRAVTKLVDHNDHRQQQWSQYFAQYTPPAYQLASPSAAVHYLAQQVEQITGYKFRHPNLLRAAFNHSSWPSIYDNTPSYQRLEYLGDALLDMVVADHLYRNYPGKDPSWLTEDKMAMVSNRFFAALCVELGFYKSLRYQSDSIGGHVAEYIDKLSVIKEESGDRKDYWDQIQGSVPKVLADLVESYVGAVFVDSGFDLSTTFSFFNRHILPHFTDMSIYDSYAGNSPETLLLAKLATLGCKSLYLPASSSTTVPDSQSKPQNAPTREKEKTETVISAAMIHLTILGNGTGYGHRSARAKACKDALRRLEDEGIDCREKFSELLGEDRCDCQQ